jgi:hypothetical protein
MLAPWFEARHLFDVGPAPSRPRRASGRRWRGCACGASPLRGATGVRPHRVRPRFSQRRKTLRNALKLLVDVEAIVAAGVDPTCVRKC